MKTLFDYMDEPAVKHRSSKKPSSKRKGGGGRRRGPYDIYNELVARLPPELRATAPKLEVGRKYKVTAGIYAPKSNAVRISEAVTRYGDEDIISHVMAHELAHYVLTKKKGKQAYWINRLHLPEFYRELALIAGYRDEVEAEKEEWRKISMLEERILRGTGRIGSIEI